MIAPLGQTSVVPVHPPPLQEQIAVGSSSSVVLVSVTHDLALGEGMQSTSVWGAARVESIPKMFDGLQWQALCNHICDLGMAWK